jgi:PAS domain S-box-containing protein
MFWDSVPLMTATDLLIVGVAAYAMWRSRLIGLSRGPSGPRRSVWLVALGLLIVGLFYFLDLVSMYLLPSITSEQEAMAFMHYLHHNFSWLVVLFALAATSVGFTELVVELQKRDAKVRRLVDSNILGVFIRNHDGQIIDANEAFLRIVGYDRNDLVSGRLRWRELTPAEWREADDQREAELKSSGVAQPYEKEYFQKGGRRVPVLVGAATFDGTGDEGVVFVLDVTDRKKAEAEVREGERRYREAQIELAHASRVATLGQLSASIGHEVNQPIAAALTNADAALRWLSIDPPNLDEVRQALARVVKSGNQAREVIGRINAFIRKAAPRKDALSINETILEIIGLTRAEAVKDGVSVQTQLSEDLPLIYGDRVQLQQVILNLIVNAVEAMRDLPGSRELLISSSWTDADCVSVMIRDTGPGLAPLNLARLFEPFYTTKSTGLGMGLSICRSIIEGHGGRLWATPNLPRGATFTFALPVRMDVAA